MQTRFLTSSAVALSLLFSIPQHSLYAAPPIAAPTTISYAALENSRVQQISRLLPAQPGGLGPHLSNRAAWNALAATNQGRALLIAAREQMAQPLPANSDELFLEYSRNGNRTRWQNVASQRRGRLVRLVTAECLENKGLFLPDIIATIDALCAEKTWVMPAHDSSLNNFNGKIIEVDLASSALGWNMALINEVLGEKLPTATRQLIRDNVEKRVLQPFEQMFEGKRKLDWWVLTTNNWNSVCLAGVTGSALSQIEDLDRRARFVAAAEKYSQNFLNGFTSDGYCSEGLGYWNYGFGHYVLLSETVRRATQKNAASGLDWLKRPNALPPARFATRIQIEDGVAPAFADCGVNAKPMPEVMKFLNARLNLNADASGETPKIPASLFETLIYEFPPVEPKSAAGMAKSDSENLRSWFDQAGILVSRSGQNATGKAHLSVALKGGHNNEHHNHNDLGSFVVVSQNRPVLLDPGSETYTARTFSSKRYDSKLLNSWGHPVPVVAGQLQQTGAQARALVLKSDFSPTRDVLQFDLSSAYKVGELKSLTRTFEHLRAQNGTLIVRDEVQFSSPQTFGSALLTLGGFTQQADGSLLVFDGEGVVKVQIDSGGKPIVISSETIRENAPVAPIRIGIDFQNPVEQGTLTLRITPHELPDDGKLLRNGGFEVNGWGWQMPADGQGETSVQQAATGKSSLKIVDDSETAGSNVSSPRIKMAPQTTVEVSGQIFQVSGAPLGVYAKSYDEKGVLVTPSDAKGNIAPIGAAKGAIGKWEPFRFRFTTPLQTQSVQLWLHTANGAKSELFVDDVAVEIVK